MKILGIILIAGGIIALAYQGFTYKRPEQVAKIGSLEINSEKTEYVWVPPALSAIALVVGIGLVLVPRRGI